MHAPHDEQQGEPHPHPGEDFPRAELAYMVGRAQEARARRRWLQVWAIAFGLGALSLGLPTARYFESLDWLWRFAGSGPAPHGILGAPLLGLTWWTGWSLEAVAFMVSASFLAASFVALYALLGTWQASLGRNLLVAGIAVASPVVWFGATLPLDYTAALFGATLLARSLFRTEQEHPYGYLWRASTWMTIAFFLAAENLWLLCPTLWAVIDRPREREQGWLRGFGLLSVFAVVLGVHAAMQPDPFGALRQALFRDGVAWSKVLPALGVGLVGLGVSLWGLWELFAGRREPEESPPPVWVLVWVAVGLGPLVTGGWSVGPTAAFLVPMAAVGWTVRGHRYASEQQAQRVTGLALAVQVLLSAALWVPLRSSDDGTDWLTDASHALQPSDGVLSDDRAHAYWSAFRFDIPAVWLVNGEVRHSRDLDRSPGPQRWALDATHGDPDRFHEWAQRLWTSQQGPPPGGFLWLRPTDRSPPPSEAADHAHEPRQP